MQWVPRTAWRVNNLNKTYGVGEIGLIGKSVKPGTKVHPPPFLATQHRPSRVAWGGETSQHALLTKLFAAGAPFIDLRDRDEAVRMPIAPAAVTARGAHTTERWPTTSTAVFASADETAPAGPENVVNLHPHDLLSGACNMILPEAKSAQMVVFASGRQRAVNGFNALVRHGYTQVVVCDAAAATAAAQAAAKAAK